jgi:hypothetical protein
MLATSPAIPPLAVGWRLAGALQYVGARPWPGAPRAVLLDRDGTLVENVPYNGDPARSARSSAPGRRSTGCGRPDCGSASSATSRHRARPADACPGRRRERPGRELLGPFDDWQSARTRRAMGCACRKPAPGLVRAAAAALRVPPRQVIVIGDIGADVDAAVAAGARGILVPGSGHPGRGDRRVTGGRPPAGRRGGHRAGRGPQRPRVRRTPGVEDASRRRIRRPARRGGTVSTPLRSRVLSSGWTATATCCWRDPRSGPSPGGRG